jgi:hypothetical protein
MQMLISAIIIFATATVLEGVVIYLIVAEYRRRREIHRIFGEPK